MPKRGKDRQIQEVMTGMIQRLVEKAESDSKEMPVLHYYHLAQTEQPMPLSDKGRWELDPTARQAPATAQEIVEWEWRKVRFYRPPFEHSIWISAPASMELTTVAEIASERLGTVEIPEELFPGEEEAG